MIRSGSLIEKYFRYFEDHSYRQADMIGLMSEKNRTIFNDMTKARYSTEILRNWAALCHMSQILETTVSENDLN